ncbi:MAG TPA: RsmG family class I SAM-dependent methyltransferase [Nannocystis sp.]
MSAGNLQVLLEPHVSAIGLKRDVPWAKLEELGRQWLRFGRAMNLSGAKDLQGLAEQIAEGLEVVALAEKLGCTEGDRWVDVGSGAGFPGLIVASCLPVEIWLVEPRERRAAFLELMLAQVRAKGRVVRGRLEDGGVREERGGLVETSGFRWASARAVFSPEVWVQRSQVLLAEQGVTIVHLHRGDADPLGLVAAASVDGERWSVRGYRRFT